MMEKEIKDTIKELKKYPEVAAIILFGSHAKGSAKPLSDIDIAVLIRNPTKKIEAEIAGSSSSKIDVVNFHRLPLYVQFEVLKYGKPIYVADKDYLIETKRRVLGDYLEMSYFYGKRTELILS